MNFRKLLHIGILNTLRLNIHYFGWGGVLHPQILASRHLKILKLGGTLKTSGVIGGIQIGLNDIRIFDKKFERCIWSNSGSIVCKGRITLGQGVRISNTGTILFENRVSIQANSTIICQKEITFQEDTLISWDTLIMDTDFHRIYDRNQMFDSNKTQLNLPSKIIIGEHTWIGCRCLILKGCRIPANSIIAAGSTVTKQFIDEYTILGNNKILKDGVEWKV